MFLISALLLCGFLACAVANDMCLNTTEYDFYIMRNLVKDFENRIQSLKQNVKEVLKARCPDRACADDWVSYNGSCYYFENAKTYNFLQARAFCKQNEAVMLFVKDEAENFFIRRMLGRLSQPNGGTRENCARYSVGNSKRWHDIPCTTKYPVICKKEK